MELRKSSDNPADAGTRGVSANSLRDSPWLKVFFSFLRTHDWPFKPPKEVENKLKAKKSGIPTVEQEPSEFMTTLCATVNGMASGRSTAHTKNLCALSPTF